jgi:hypothetical protein
VNSGTSNTCIGVRSVRLGTGMMNDATYSSTTKHFRHEVITKKATTAFVGFALTFGSHGLSRGSVLNAEKDRL